jgi:hypothetical protein
MPFDYYNRCPDSDYFKDDTFLIDLEGDLWHYSNEQFYPSGCGVNNPENFVIEQFTGLTDRHGKEIYEGDVIKEKNNPKVFAIESVHDLCEYIDDTFYAPDTFEIIGNVHEHPELLNPTGE